MLHGKMEQRLLQSRQMNESTVQCTRDLISTFVQCNKFYDQICSSFIFLCSCGEHMLSVFMASLSSSQPVHQSVSYTGITLRPI